MKSPIHVFSRIMRKSRAKVLFLLLFSTILHGQDLHFTQAFEHPMFLNPSLTSCGKCSQLAGLLYRNQWSQLDMPVKSYSAFYEVKFQPKFMRRDHFAIGGYFFNESAGDGPLKTNGFMMNVALKKYLGWGRDTLFVSIGFGFGRGQRSINFDNLKFPSQWNGLNINPSQPTDLNNYYNHINYWDMNGGMNIFYKPYNARYSFDAGLSLSHINQPDISFAKANDKSDQLPQKINFHARYHRQFSGFFSMMAGGLYSAQNPYDEFVFGVNFRHCLVQKQSARLDFNSGEQSPVGLLYGVWLRSDPVRDISPTVGLTAFGLNMLMSYDIPFFNSKHVTSYKGSFEISVSKNFDCKYKSRCNCGNYGF